MPRSALRAPGSTGEPPITHFMDPIVVRNELDYDDMVALSGMFRRWALYEPRQPPHARTQFMAWSADLERIAAWVGESWLADDLPETPLLKFVATLERNASGVIKMEHARHWLRLE